jgi:hypothetical protein
LDTQGGKMKAKLFATLAVLTMMAFPSFAEESANIVRAPWNCALTFHAVGGGIQLVVGVFKVSGKGMIACENANGDRQQMDVKVTMGTAPIAANLAIGHFELTGLASGIGVAMGPQDILGDYYTVGGQAAVIVGVGANLPIHGESNALNITLGINVSRGFGLQLGFNKVSIEPM